MTRLMPPLGQANRVGEALIGKIIDKRYVVLEALDAAEGRFAAYDMKSLGRTEIRLDSDGALLTVNGVDQPVKPTTRPALTALDGGREPAPSVGVTETSAVNPEPIAAPKRTALPEMPPARLVPPPNAVIVEPQIAAPTTAAASVGAQPNVERAPLVAPVVAPPPIVVAEVVTAPSTPPIETPAAQPERIAASAAVASEVIVPVIQSAAPPKADGTEPLLLHDAEELPLVNPATGQRRRLPTKRIEAAWFAQGDELEEDNAPAEPWGADPGVKDADLRRCAESLSPAAYRRFALELPPLRPHAAQTPETSCEAAPQATTADQPPGLQPATAQRELAATPIIAPQTQPETAAPRPASTNSRTIVESRRPATQARRSPTRSSLAWLDEVRPRAPLFFGGLACGVLLGGIFGYVAGVRHLGAPLPQAKLLLPLPMAAQTTRNGTATPVSQKIPQRRLVAVNDAPPPLVESLPSAVEPPAKSDATPVAKRKPAVAAASAVAPPAKPRLQRDKKPRRGKVKVLIKRARRHYRRSAWRRARRDAIRVLRLKPRHRLARRIKAQAEARLGI
ncbi:MAG: hypothetical protein H6707_08865 [Deltaproteobacteria bacterium]|nr:hypothetical protein [Deltaproteobacteria bacterium]